MKVLVTGANGFVGKNLIAQLENIRDNKERNHPLNNKIEIYKYDRDNTLEDLDKFTLDCDFVMHLAGVNRPKEEKDFMEGNYGFTSTLLESLKKNKNQSPILITSSIQAELDNPYGISKKAGEELIFKYGKENNSKVLVYRLANVFGKWCRPNYNSVIATFCYNIANDKEIKVNDPSVVMNLVYIDDLVNELINSLLNKENKIGDYCQVPTSHTITLGKIVELLYSFKESRSKLSLPNFFNELEKKLYSTYLSYLPTDQFSYPLKMNVDNRGSFTEIIRTESKGQFSVNKSKPGITKGNHWHHTKVEKFVVVKGQALIQFRKIGDSKVIDYHVSGEQWEVVDIPTGYTHNIINEGNEELITFMWANEAFNPDRPDTYFEEV